jgi:glycosyltransferase involved in cell wall biosynthesis
MTGTSKVSVVISFFNAEKYLREAIESVLGQTFTNWELLLVDDGSTDASTQLALELAERFPDKIRYLQHEGHVNRGLPASRNRAMEAARSNYIAILDADDLWLPKKLEEQLAILNSHPDVAMVYGRTEYFHTGTGHRPEDYRMRLGVEADRVYPAPELFRIALAGLAGMPCPSDLLFRKDPIRRLGGFEEEFRGIYGMHEDQAFLTKVFLHTKVFVSAQVWDRYRLHQDSMSAVGDPLVSERYFLAWLKQYLNERGIVDDKIWHSLRKRLWRNRHPQLSAWRRRLKQVVRPRAS